MSEKKEKEYSDEVSVYTLKQAEFVAGKWHKDLASIQNEGFKISEKQAELHNSNFKNSGSFYDLDKGATEKYKALISKKKKG